MDREFNQIDLVTACAGKEIIRPARGYAIFLDSRTVTEDQLNAMCSNAVYMEVCITISESQFKSLRCPKLQYLVSCRPANKMKRNYRQWFGSVRIEPQPGSTLVFDSSTIPERDMNKIFENVVNMKACLVISNSDYTYFRAPNLRYVESCAPGKLHVGVLNLKSLKYGHGLEKIHPC
ncbi:hypothetical protein ANCDUO_23215 [Ancylostoma duodenale]|uniref:Uncharacterized protein n=1 Tax=Ancylostoma duodenale TaxID=51022 RepID=A0A0C2FDV4_9BILA|nr:hypothetical protein ANCDUO_23215 [Ancylostoma duodenale]